MVGEEALERQKETEGGEVSGKLKTGVGGAKEWERKIHATVTSAVRVQ